MKRLVGLGIILAMTGSAAGAQNAAPLPGQIIEPADTMPFQNAVPVPRQPVERADITFNVRLAVKGDPTLITSGIRLRCNMNRITADGRQLVQRVEKVVVPSGAVFVPETADGFIETTLTVKDVHMADELQEADATSYRWS